MPLPGYNPMEKAPPPGSTEMAASAAQAARLHQRISDLERRVLSVETATRTSGWQPIPGLTYTSPFAAFDSGYAPAYRIVGDMVFLSGLISAVGAAGAVGTVFVLPSFLHPEWPITGSAGSRAQFFPVAGFTGASPTTYTIIIYPRDSTVQAGRLSTNFSIPSGGYFSLSGVQYGRRLDQ